MIQLWAPDYSHVYHYAVRSLYTGFSREATLQRGRRSTNEVPAELDMDKQSSTGRKYVHSRLVHDMTDNKTSGLILRQMTCLVINEQRFSAQYIF